MHWWLSGLLLLSSLARAADAVRDEQAVSPVWAEQYLRQHHPHLLQDSEQDHVLSLYYFGRYGTLNLLGMERVKGEHYEQFFTLLLFSGQTLLGYYPDVLSFPSAVTEQGEVRFPVGIQAHLQGSGQSLSLPALLQQPQPLCQGLGALQRCVVWQQPDRH